MEETREQQKLHGFLQCAIYISIGIEAAIFIYHDAPFWGIFFTPLDKLSHLVIYSALVYSKLTTFGLICLVSIGTLAKRKQTSTLKSISSIRLQSVCFCSSAALFLRVVPPR
ncbi:hypothetical protein [Mucilaginibacter antarcticus]|uniref:hypothetical protein n=1 Tax=Mucilaginibacter antarcticus TaxID=1855725 RepID=UPI00362C1CB5